MLEDHIKLLYALSVSGEIIGRKKLQKMIYISKKLSYPFQEKFHFHFFGPYSEELTLRVEELINLGLIGETKEKKGGYYQYRYHMTDNGLDFLRNNPIDMPLFASCFTNMNEQSSRFLELVSTVLFFDTLSKEEVVEKVSTLKAKSNYTEEEIDQAYTYIELLKNITKNPEPPLYSA